MTTSKCLVVLILILFVDLSLSMHSILAVVELGSIPVGNVSSGIKDLSEELNYANILEHVDNISRFGSRVTGYNGSTRTAEYIANQLGSYGLNVTRHLYKTIVPIDEGSSVVVLGSQEVSLKAYAVWPNGIQTSPTPPEGVTGHLIYAGKGELEDFDGKEVSGSIVLMDYESGDNWLNAAKFGAKGVIFIALLEPSIYAEALAKFTDTPLYFPRLFVDYETGSKLVEAAGEGLSVRIHSRIYYREITAENVIGILQGSQSGEAVIVSSHYDSWTPVPGLANSALEAISPAYLLELSRVVSKTKPLRTVWFVFFSGHWQALSGSREFVEDYYFSPEVQSGTFKPLMLINVGDLDPMGSGLDLIRGGVGTLYGSITITGKAEGLPIRYGWTRRQIFTNYLYDPNLSTLIVSLTGTEPSILVRDFFTSNMFWGTESGYFMFDSEPAEMTRGVSFTIQTGYTDEQWRGDPYQDYELSLEKISHLTPQMLIIGHLVISFVNEPIWGDNWSEISPSRAYMTQVAATQYSGFLTLEGKTLEYNLSSGWYNPIPHALVRVSLGLWGETNYVPYPLPFSKYLTYSDGNGSFEIHGFSHYAFVPARYIVEAWIVNETSGKIVYAPNAGIYGAKTVVPVSLPQAHPEKSSVVLMKVGVVTLFDVFNPRTGMPGLIPDKRSPTFGRLPPTWGAVVSGWTAGWLYRGGISVIPQDFISKTTPLFYGGYYNGYETVALSFALPDSDILVMGKIGGSAALGGAPLARPTLILVNGSESEPEGHGIRVIGESPSVFDSNALDYARDIILITRSRYNNLLAHGVRSLSVEEKLSKAEAYLEESAQMYLNKNYSNAYAKALNAWALCSSTYEDVMTLVDDSGRTSLFFFSLIIPVSLLFERLLIHSQGKRQLIWILSIGTLLLTLFWLVHPALSIMVSANLAILGLVSLTLFAITAAILADESNKIMKELSHKILGYHTMEIGTIGLVATTFSVTIENMRRRKFRTLLVFINLITIAFAFASLTSVSPYTDIKFVPLLGGSASYEGILVKIGFSVPPDGILTSNIIGVVEGAVGEEARILPRSWYYPASIGPMVGVVTQLRSDKNTGENLTYPINAMLGMTSQEIENVFWDYSETPILPMKKYDCLIPDTAAKILGVDLGDGVIFQGQRFKIAGILNTTLLNSADVRDLSQVSIFPTDPYYVPSLGIDVFVSLLPGQNPEPLYSPQIIVVPYDVVLEYGGYVAEISIRFPSNIGKEAVLNVSRNLTQIIDLPVYVGVGGKVFATSKVPTFSALGLEGIIIILVLGSLNVVITLFNIQKERTRDMYVYTTVGLSPRGAITMCILESATYSLLGVIIGYFAGFIGNAVFAVIGVLPQNFTFNYASIFLVFSLVALLLSALLSSMYPAYLASRLITPSLERKWKPPTKPKRGLWEVPLPLRISEVDEVKGLLTFFKEYYLGSGTEKAHFRVTEVDIVSMSSPEPKLDLEVTFVPYEAGIKSSVTINTLWNEKTKKYDFTILAQKTLGDEKLWADGSYYFIDDLRTQTLLWRFLKVEDRRKYIAMAGKEA